MIGETSQKRFGLLWQDPGLNARRNNLNLDRRTTEKVPILEPAQLRELNGQYLEVHLDGPSKLIFWKLLDMVWVLDSRDY